jgi:hypothetical protein
VNRTEDASKEIAAVGTVGVRVLREELGEGSADRPSGSRCKGGTSSTHWLQLRNVRRADWRYVGKRQVANTTRRNTDASVSGGATGMSGEASVMDAEQSGGVVRLEARANSATRMSR